jgi:ligand-binding SRPBCC domain-containing protein
MRSYKLHCQMRVSKSLSETFAVFENPHNLALITPPWLNFKVLHEHLEMRRGLLIDYTIRWLGIGIRWRTRITSYDAPYGFTDMQERGPFELWHHVHRFAEEAGGTVVRDEVTYVLPLGPLGRLAHAMLVKRQLLAIFRYRQKALARMLGGITELNEPCAEAGSTVTEQQLAQYRA